MPKYVPKARLERRVRRAPLDATGNRRIKRTTDVLGASILILLTLPIQFVAAIGVRLSSPGPVLFRQTRVGKDMRPFTMYKFRSMRVNDDAETGWSGAADPRRTKFGALIRKLSIDELPQLYNVLIGNMSLVGPRPEIPFYVRKFEQEIPLYRERHRVAPGITGLAQIKGLRGDTSIKARVREDLYYIEHWTFWMDVRILLLTPLRAFNKQERLGRGGERGEGRG